MNTTLKLALAVGALAVAAQASAQVTFYEDDNFQGRSFTTDRPVGDFSRYGFNDRASSVVVVGERWEVCEDIRFGGRCVVLRPGRYASLGNMALNDRVSSVRPMQRNARIDDSRYAPPAEPVYDNRRRNQERLFQANVDSVRAVVGVAGQRCWTERERVAQPNQDNSNVGAAVAGALIGGILGHQVGGGTGKDLATVGGAVAGAAVGANVARNNAGQQVSTQNVQRCVNEPSQDRPAYWDVSYNFRGQEHRIQMTNPPGPTITVNAQGEPRS
jgi:uncharacterized protein YcfJ